MSDDTAVTPRYYSTRSEGDPRARRARDGGGTLDTRGRLKTLIQEKCILRGEFVLASGQKSSVYFDCKRATLDPEGLHLIATLLLEQIDRLERDDGRRIDALGGPTIGADPVVGHLAGRSFERSAAGAGHPVRGFLVRKATKDHGTGRLIENDIPAASRVVVFEDVVTTAKSTLEAIATIEAAGLVVAAVVAVVDREQGGAEALSRYRFLPLFRKSEFGL
jgi:orotate phosphoribosyltransferase